MRSNLLIIFTLLILIDSVFASPVDSLNRFYQSSVDEDIDSYISVQDPFFLKLHGNNSKEYFRSVFNDVKILDYRIIDPDVFVKDNRALIFYELKGDFEYKGKKHSVDNDMVAFLWRYDDWKIRWTITRRLYENKIAMAMIMDSAIESIFEEAKNKTLKQEMINKGVKINIEEGDIHKQGFSHYLLILLLVLIIVLLIVFRRRIFKMKNDFKKEKLKLILKEIKKIYKRFYAWCNKELVPRIIIFLKFLWRWIKIISKKIYVFSKRLYKNKIKPKIKKTGKGLKEHKDSK